MRNSFAGILITVSLISWSSLTQANIVGNDTQNFNPVTNGLGFVTVQSTDTLLPGFVNSGVFVNTAKNVLPPLPAIIGDDYLTMVDLSFGAGITRNLEAGLNLSYLINQSLERNGTGAEFSKTGLNEVRGNIKYHILDREPIGLAVIASANFNQTKNNPFLGANAGITSNIEFAADMELQNILLGFNLGYRFRQPGEPIPNAISEPLSDQLVSSVGISRYLPKWDLKLISELLAAKSTKGSNLTAEVLLGGKYDSSQNTSIQVGLGTRLASGLFTPDWRIYLGFNYSFDALGIQQSPPSAVVVSQQINEPIKVVEQTTVIKGFSPRMVETLAERTFDEVATTHEFQLRTEVPEADGSNKPPFEVIRLNGLEFEFGKSDIKDSHRSLLDRLAKYLNSDPPVLKVRIEGHTDSLGTETRNQKRSDDRAEKVKLYLASKGVRPSSGIESAGYGSKRPIADNADFQGRAQNRRVEVRILRSIRPDIKHE